MSRRPLWRWLLATLAAQLGACRGSSTPSASWSSDGGDLEQRVRAGQLEGVSQLRFTSSILGREVSAVVATPQGYARSGERRYPVIYIFPGIGGDEWTYLRSVTLDNPCVHTLFAQPERAPILVFANPADSAAEGPALSVLADELVRAVDERYRTRADAAGRGLQGFSLGGVTALSLYLQRADKFGHVVALSSACYLLASCQALRSRLVAQARQLQEPQVMLAVGGREDQQNRLISAELAPLLGAKVETLDGAGHDWAMLLRAKSVDVSFGQRIAEFHLRGFAEVFAR